MQQKKNPDTSTAPDFRPGREHSRLRVRRLGKFEAQSRKGNVEWLEGPLAGRIARLDPTTIRKGDE